MSQPFRCSCVASLHRLRHSAHSAIGLLFGLFLFLVPGSSASGQGYPPDEAASRMSVADGLTVTLFASEPQVRQPIFCKCDDRGRLWTIQYLQYPNPAGLRRVSVDRFSRTIYDRVPDPPPRGPQGADRITILEDTDGDGTADRFRDFVTGLNLCTGVEFGYDGVFVMQVPYLLFYPDRDRNDVPDSDPEVLLEGFGMEDAQSLANHLTWGPDGWLYGLNGSTTTCRVRGIEFQQGVWRYHPVTRQFELFCEGGGNLFGLTFDRYGRLFYSSNGGLFYHGVQGGYYEKNFGKHGPLHNPFTYGYFVHVRHNGDTGRPNPGATMYLGQTFPERYHNSLMISDFLSHTCSWWTLQPLGSTIQADLGGRLLNSNDSWFGATDLCLGPRGEVYVSDFCDQRTAHPDPDAQWDTSNGRIYRITATTPAGNEGIDATTALASSSPLQLKDLLTQPNGWLTQRARRHLSERQDPATWPALREMALQSNNSDWRLEALWALHGAGGLDQTTAAALLNDASEHVRAWTARLLGDAGEVSPDLEQQLVRLAATDESVIVRAQLAATAKRLRGPGSVTMLDNLLARGGDPQDPHVPLLIWWGIESKVLTQRAEILKQFASAERWQQPAFHSDLLRLLRRYAAEGSHEGYLACVQLLETAIPAMKGRAFEALHQGLTERSGAGSELQVSDELQQILLTSWQQHSTDPLQIRLCLQAQVDGVYEHMLKQLDESPPMPLQLEYLKILADHGREDCIPRVAPLVSPDVPEPQRRAALNVLQRFSAPEVTRTILDQYATMSPDLRSFSRDILFRRTSSALAFLSAVEEQRIAAKEVPLEQLRPLALLQNDDVQRRVRNLWGNIQPATPEERLADVRRFSNDLRAGSGSPDAGKPLFAKHCGNCHKLHGAGNSIGPDLSGTVRGDQMSLLTNIVAPSSVVRLEYLSYVVVTKDGAILTGLIAEQDGASITLLDAKNQRIRISRSDIEELGESPVSLMPEKLLEQLTPQELRDLFAFLQQAPSDSTAE